MTGTSPSSGSDATPPMDGLSSPQAETVSTKPNTQGTPTEQAPATDAVRRTKRGLLLVGGAAYVAYGVWCVLLLSLLPNPAGEWRSLASVGVLTCLAAALLLLGIGTLAVQRIAQSKLSVQLRRRSLIMVVLAILPGLLLSAATPFFITREPTLALAITSPATAQELVAPVPVTISAASAAAILQKLDLRVVKYVWDTNADGVADEETITPETTVVFERQGIYTVTARLVLQDGSFRRATRRIVIPQAVFSVTPSVPVLQKPVQLSVAHLLADPKLLQSVTWTFSDASDPQTAKNADVVHTFYATGTYEVTAEILLSNNTQATFKRIVNVQEAPPLPFPVVVASEPETLLGPAPFGALFTVQTEEPLREVHWNFGDGKEERGADLTRIGHSYEQPGIYPVLTRIRSASGQLAEITTIVRVAETLSLPDLTFEGNRVQAGKVQGEAPLTLNLTPKTIQPLITFSWEYPSDSPLVVDGQRITGVFRAPGSYTVTLIAQNAEGKVARLPIRIQVDPPAAEPTILLKPDGGTAPLNVMFDASQSFIPPGETIAGFKWSFGDEADYRGSEEVGPARIEHLYKTPGDYTVTLKIVLSSGKEFTTTRTLVVRRPTLRACFSSSRLRVESGKAIEFDASCTAGVPQSFFWDVRYNPQPEIVVAQSTDPRYVSVFQNPGDYTVTLTVKDQWNNQDVKSVTITVTSPDTPSES